MKFGLRNGPWKTLFAGKFQGHDIEILMNPGQVMLVAIYETDGEEITGVVLQAFSVFSAVGEAETFVESLQREAVILSRHDGKHTVQFLALASKQSYSKAKDEAVATAVDSLLEEAEAAGTKVTDIAKSFDLKLTPLQKCSSAVKQAFFSQPAVIPMLVREKQAIEAEKEEAMLETNAEGAAVVLGITKDGKQVREPLKLFQRNIVSDGTLQQRNNVIQIIIESFLLANVPVIVFDKGNDFAGLGQPTRKIGELKAYGIHIEPIGFPKKEFEPGSNLKVNLNAVSAAGLLELFGCRDKEVQAVLESALKKGPVESPSQLVDNIEALGRDDSENLFVKRRAARIIRLVDVLYPELFAGKNNLEDIVKSWFKKIGRVSIVHIDKADPRELTFLLDSLSNELVGLFRQEGETEKPKLLLAVPQVEGIFAIRSSLVLKDFVKMLTEMKRFGISFVVGADNRSDVGRELLQILETKAGIIKENDVAIDLPDSKNYRVLIRSTLSQTKEEA